MIIGIVRWLGGVMQVENKNFAEWCAETETEEEREMARKTTHKFSLDELKKLGFDFTDYQKIDDDAELEEYDYFTVGYNPHYQLISVDGIHNNHSHTVLSFDDALDNYRIKYEE